MGANADLSRNAVRLDLLAVPGRGRARLGPGAVQAGARDMSNPFSRFPMTAKSMAVVTDVVPHVDHAKVGLAGGAEALFARDRRLCVDGPNLECQ